MVSTEGLVPITRAFLASYYDKYPFSPLSGDVSRLTEQIYAMATDLLKESPPAQGESLLIQEAGSEPPHKVDENMWKNREQIEEIIFLLQAPNWPRALQQQSTVVDDELVSVLGRLLEKFKSTLGTLEAFQARNSEFVFNTVMTYMPQDFRGNLIRQQKERSERNKQAAVDALTSSGGSIRDKYAMLWKQQMERRRQLAELGSATGVYKTLMKYLVGVPQVLMDFVRQINDDQGPMEEQRQRYGPPLYSLPRMVHNIRLFLALLWGRLETRKLQKHQISILEEAATVYTSELERFINFIGDVFTNSPFLIAAEDAGALAARNNDDYKEISVSAGGTHERLVDMLEEKSHLPAVLQSLGCIAQAALPVYETREFEVEKFIKEKILELGQITDGSTCWDDISELCSLKIFGLKALVKRYSSAKDPTLPSRIDEFIGNSEEHTLFW